MRAYKNENLQRLKENSGSGKKINLNLRSLHCLGRNCSIR